MRPRMRVKNRRRMREGTDVKKEEVFQNMKIKRRRVEKQK